MTATFPPNSFFFNIFLIAAIRESIISEGAIISAPDFAKATAMVANR